MTQWTFDDLVTADTQRAWSAQSLRRWADLRPGDVVEVDGLGGAPWSGICAAPHTGDCWYVQVATGPWKPGQERYRMLARHTPWRATGHEDGWTITPSVEEVTTWMAAAAPTWPADQFWALYHMAADAWPWAVNPAGRAAVNAAFTAAAIAYLPVAHYLNQSRKISGAGRRIWACPPRIQRLVAETIWPLPGAERLVAAQALRWTRAEHFGSPTVPEPMGELAFNHTPCSIYDGYLRWAIAHAATPRQLLELLDEWGSNPPGGWAAGKEQA
jgi:hypothetical protein